MAARRQPFDPALVALGGVHAATAVGLLRVFAGSSWVLACVAEIALALGVAVLLDARRARGIVVMGAQAFAGLWFASVVVVPSRTIVGLLPTPGGVGELLGHLGRSGTTLRGAVVPVAPAGAALALALVATWAATAAAHWSWSRLDGTLAALVPSLALFIATAALGKGTSWWAGSLWALAAATFLLVVHAHSEASERSPFRTASNRPSRALTGGALTLITVCIGATIVAPALPGARSHAWFDYRALGTHGGDGGTVHAVSPLDDIGAQLNDADTTELFVVTTTQPSRWRLLALDNFDGRSWTRLPELSTDRFVPQGWARTIPTLQVESHFAIGPMRGEWLPTAFEAQTVAHLDHYQVVGGSSLYVTDKSHQGLRYRIDSEEPDATAQQLRDAGLNPTAAIEPPESNRTLPIDFPSSVRELAERTVRNAGPTDFDKALALQEYLRGPLFTYNQKVRFTDPDHALEDFLFTKRQGFCQQFAGAMAAMARAIGLPARVAVGFEPGQNLGDGYHVTNKDAHAWPEVWIAGAGWIGFEPTKSRFDSTTPHDPTGTGHEAPSATTTTPTTAAGPTTTIAGGHTATTRPFRDARNNPSGRTGSGAGGIGTPSKVGIVLAALVLALAIVNGLRVWSRRRRREVRMHAASARRRVQGAWFDALDALAGLGLEPRASATPIEFARTPSTRQATGDAAAAALVTLAQLHSAASFAADDPGDGDAVRAWDCAERIRAAAREQRPPRPWWRRALVWS